MAGKREKFVDKHVLKSFYIRADLWPQFDDLGKSFGHGAKTDLINEAIELILKKYAKEKGY